MYRVNSATTKLHEKTNSKGQHESINPIRNTRIKYCQ